MRLRWGPYASRLAEQVLVRDPFYVVQVLAREPHGGLAYVLQGLVEAFDARPLRCDCARCSHAADGVCAYPGSITLIGFCDRCSLISSSVRPSPTLRVTGYESAIRHVASSFPRGHRIWMRRIVGELMRCKGGPAQATEAGVVSFLRGAPLVEPLPIRSPVNKTGAMTELARTQPTTVRSRRATGAP